MPLATLVTGILFATCFGGLAFVLLPYLSGEVRAEKRQDQFINRAEAREKAAVQRSAANRREQITKSLKEIEQRQSANKKVDLATRIAQAGLTWTKQRYYLLGAALALVVGLLTYIVSRNIMVGLGEMLVGGLGVPRWLLIYLTKKRVKLFLNEFPNAIDVVVRGVRSGLPLGDCIRVIATEAQQPVRGEFRHIIESQGLGLSIAEACERLYQRVPVTEASFFGIVIAIQQKSGGNLAETLSNFSRVIRERRKMKGKIQAMSSEAKASAAIIACLPFVVAILVYLSSPAYITLLWTTTHGKIVMLASAFWMFSGIMVMRKMIQFDF
jgi:tight adherence protein B